MRHFLLHIAACLAVLMLSTSLTIAQETLTEESSKPAEAMTFSADDAFSMLRRRIKSNYPHTGAVKNVVILVQYKDVSFSLENPKERFQKFFNEEHYSYNYATGSVRDYFRACSMDQFQPSFDVYGPYTLSKDRSYYGEPTGSRHDSHAAQMVLEACELAKNDIDFSLYDNNNDGIVDNISIVFAGHNEAEHGPEESIWPHRSTVSTSTKYNGKTLNAYLCTSELRGNQGTTMCGIGTYCHEFSHVLGIPDLYDTNNSDRYTVGQWDIMSAGNYVNEGRTPPLYNAFTRFMLGWLTPVQLSQPNTYLLHPIETHNEAYLIAAESHNLNATAPSPEEYFLVENRQRIGWDSVYQNRTGYNALPGTGLLITHITFSSEAWDSNKFNNYDPLGFNVVEAYENNEQTSASPSDTYPGTYNINQFTPQMNSGTKLQSMMLSNILQIDNDMSFHFGELGGDGIWFDPLETVVMTTTFDKRVVHYDTMSVNVICQNIGSKTMSVKTQSSAFQFSIDQGKTWHSTNAANILTDGTDHFTFPLLLRYSPTIQNCNFSYGMLEVATEDRQFVNRLMLRGTSPRPIYIEAPQVSEVSNVTPYSFKFRWTEQEDAESYYLTIYNISSEPSDIVQSFEDFDTDVAIAQQGWSSNFHETTTAQSDDGSHSLLFTETGQYIQSEVYKTPITQLSFWLNNNYTTVGTETPGGKLRLSARSNEGEWHTIDSVFVRTTTRYLTKTVTFNATDDIIQFRLEYTHTAGNGGVLLDTWTAHSDYTINYKWRDRDREVQAPQTVAIVDELQPNTLYYIQIQAEESKGCDTHLTDLSEPFELRTLPGTDKENQFLIAEADDGNFIAYLPEMGDQHKKLFIYTAEGELVTTIDITAGASQAFIPSAVLTKGKVYMCKYASTSQRLKRKAPWAKFIY